MKNALYNLVPAIILIAYGDGDGDGTNTGTGTQQTVKTFTEAEVKALVEKEASALKTKLNNTLTEVNALRSKETLTKQERDELDARLQQMQSELLSKEELAKMQFEKTKKETAEAQQKLQVERDTWQKRYMDSTIAREITDAAVTHGAFNTNQLVTLLRGNTKLVEVVGEDGKPTGDFQAKATITVQVDGKSKTLELPVSEAVKQLKEQDDYANLFKGQGTGGTGGSNTRKAGGEIDIQNLAKNDPAKYRQLRKEGKIKF
jgi:hypothetical protein